MEDPRLTQHQVSSATHAVGNQPPPLEDYDAFRSDQPLVEGVARQGASWAVEDLGTFGATCGSADVLALGFAANENPPVLHTHDRFGKRIDEVHFHPAYHALMRLGTEVGIHARPWAAPAEGAQVARAAKHYLFTQVEAGVMCPLTMTFAAVPALRQQADLAARWVPRLLHDAYDARLLPAAEKAAATIGMAMTEKQGGSDVRANTTRAVPVATPGPGQPYRLTGHKWFCSAPMSDAFLMLAKTDDGLSCFLVPRVLENGQRNVFRIQRLKSKLGNRANASSEIELDATWGEMVGPPGRGVPTIIEMVNHTRLDCVIGSAGIMRQALVQAIHHAVYRQAFGRRLIDQSAMRLVLADLALEVEASIALALRLAAAYDRDDRPACAFRRLATAAGKYWVTKRTAPVVAEALECLGGNGFVEESILPRLYREAPLNSIWEGSGNVMCLDVLRAAASDAEVVPALLDEIGLARGADRRFDAFVTELMRWLPCGTRSPDEHQASARRLTEMIALALQGALLLRHAPSAVADGFVATRLERTGGLAFGTLPAGLDVATILARAWPHAR